MIKTGVYAIILISLSVVPSEAQTGWQVLGKEDQVSAVASDYTSITTTSVSDSALIPSFGQTHWEILGEEDQISAVASDYTSVTAITEDNKVIPYVAYSEEGTAKVKKYANGSWLQVGGDVSTGHASYTNVFSDHEGKLYIAYVDNDNGHRLIVKTYDSNMQSWEPLGGDAANLYVSTGSVVNGTSQLKSSHNSWIAFDANNVPYVIYAEMDDGGKAYVKRFDEGSWQIVGGSAVSTIKASGVGIAFSSDNVPFIVYSAGTGSTGQITVQKLTNNQWESLNVPASLSSGRRTDGARHTAIAVVDKQPYVIYMDGNHNSLATVIAPDTLTGEWLQIGGTLSGRNTTYLNLAKGDTDNLYASFVDVMSNGSGRSVVRVMRWNKEEATWNEVKDSTSTQGIDEPGSSLSMTVGDDNSPYVIYIKPSQFNSQVSTPVVRHFPPVYTKQRVTTVTPYVAYSEEGTAKVKKYANGSWLQVGGDVSTGHASYTNVFSDHEGKLYIAYVDNDNGHRLIVKTFDSHTQSWEPLGGDAANLYVSTGSVVNGTSQLKSSHNSWIAFDANNVPYVIYAEMDDGGKAYVKRFDEESWQIVGGSAVSTIKASGVGIAFSSDNVPFIVYSAGTGSTGQITVQKLTNNQWESLNVPASLSSGRRTDGARHTAIAVVDRQPYVIYMDGNHNSLATVIAPDTLTGEWLQIGGTLSGRNTTYLSIAKDSADNLYASFIDVMSNGSGRSVVRVMKLEKGSDKWMEVKGDPTSEGIDEPGSDLSIAIGNYSPYIIYIKPAGFDSKISTPVIQFFPVAVEKPNDTTVKVIDKGATVVVSNGIVTFTVEKSSATITNLTYKGVNVLEGGHNGGMIYWSWNMPNYQNPSGCTYSLIIDPKSNNGDYAELRFHMPWNGSASTAAMDVDVYYSLTREAQGVYASAMLTHPAEYPANPGGEWRMSSYVGSMFDWLSVDSLRNRLMASPEDWSNGTQPDGAPKEVRLLNSGIYKGEYECKYDYSADFGDLDVWGWSSTTKDLGIWVTAPSKEYYNGGPMKRELTGHNGPTLLNMLGGQHYGMGNDGAIAAGESWQKVYGPFLIYVNSAPSGTADAPAALWADAQEQAKKEQSKWPYDWYSNPQYVHEDGRGTITGTLAVIDTTDTLASAVDMWIGVTIPPQSVNGIKDFQKWNKNFQFWTKTDSEGHFTISHVLPGTYNMYAFGPGAAGQMTKTDFVTVTAGQTVDLGTVTWVPDRTAPTVWEIGVPDRSAKEFRHGKDWWESDSLPSTHWGKFMDYSDEFPNDVNFIIGKSDWSKDWNYVQPFGKNNINDLPSDPVWTVKFNLTKNPEADSVAAVYVAYAASYSIASVVKVNGTNVTDPETGIYPPNASNAMIRKGIHGAFGDHRFTFPAKLLHAGENEITFTGRITGGGSMGSIMYDYVRLEAWGTAATTKNLQTITFDSIPAKYADAPDFLLKATASSGLAVNYASSDPDVATVSNGEVHITGEGRTIITASQPGDSLWLPAEEVSRVLVVARQRETQEITFNPIPDQYLGTPDYSLEATSGSGLPIAYSSNNTAVAVVSDGKIHFLAVGPVTVTASQPGDSTWAPAADVSRSFNVKAIMKPEYNRLLTPNGDGINDKLIIKHITAYPENRIRIFDEAGKLIYQKNGYDNDWDGRINGKKVAGGTYYFVFTSDHVVKIKGSLTIIH